MVAENRGPELLAVNIVFCVITGCIVILRCFTRIWLVRAFGVDDWLMVLASLFFLGYIVCSNSGIGYGTGQHKAALSTENFETAMKYWWFCYLFFSMCMITSKLSFAWFLLRIVTKRIHAWTIYMAAMLTVVGGVAFFFVTLLQCHPISHYWNKSGQGSCISMDIIVALGYLYSVFSVITDFTFAVLPGFVIWHLNLQRRARFILIVLIAMGCMASSAVVVRFAYIKNFKDEDFLWATTDIAIWTTLEMGLAISAASLSTLRPLAKIIGWKLGLTSQNTSPSQNYNPSARGFNGIRSPHPGDHVYIHSEVSQNATHFDARKSWALGTKVTAYAGHDKDEHEMDITSGTESSERLATTSTSNSVSLVEEGKALPQYFLR